MRTSRNAKEGQQRTQLYVTYTEGMVMYCKQSGGERRNPKAWDVELLGSELLQLFE